MILNWKKWSACFVIAILAFWACHFYAANNLTNFYPSPTATKTKSLEYDLHTDYQILHNVVNNISEMTDVVQLPWPNQSKGDKIINAYPQTLNDYEKLINSNTIMGLAITNHAETQKLPFESLSNIAIEKSKDPTQQLKMKRIKLFVDSKEILKDNEEDEEQNAKYKSISKKAKKIDPNNLAYFWLDIYPELLSITKENEEPIPGSKTLPSEILEQIFSLKNANTDQLTAVAGALSKKLAQLTKNSKFDCFQTDRLVIKKVALKFSYSPNFPIHKLQQSDLISEAQQFHLSKTRRSILMLCFIGDQLAKNNQDQLALDIYGHVNTICEKLITGEGEKTLKDQYLLGLGGSTLNSEHLLSYWANKGKAEKTFLAKSKLDANTKIYENAKKQIQLMGSDPIGHHPKVYENYARSASLTWWLSMTGIIFAAASLISVGLYIVLSRKRYESANELKISFKLLEIVLGTPIFIMIWLCMNVPLNLKNIDLTTSLITWQWMLILLWLIFIGLIATYCGATSEGIKKSPGRRIWIFTALGVAAGSIIASIISPAMLNVIAAGIGVIVIIFGFFIWLVVVMACWLIRRSQKNLITRARTNQAFAVCSMLACAIFLLAALASMPLTKRNQNAYIAQAIRDIETQANYYSTPNWQITMKALPASVFEIEN